MQGSNLDNNWRLLQPVKNVLLVFLLQHLASASIVARYKMHANIAFLRWFETQINNHMYKSLANARAHTSPHKHAYFSSQNCRSVCLGHRMKPSYEKTLSEPAQDCKCCHVQKQTHHTLSNKNTQCLSHQAPIHAWNLFRAGLDTSPMDLLWLPVHSQPPHAGKALSDPLPWRALQAAEPSATVKLMHVCRQKWDPPSCNQTWQWLTKAAQTLILVGLSATGLHLLSCWI